MTKFAPLARKHKYLLSQRCMCRYLGPDYGDERKGPSEAVATVQIPYLAKESFPLCMQASCCSSSALVGAYVIITQCPEVCCAAVGFWAGILTEQHRI